MRGKTPDPVHSVERGCVRDLGETRVNDEDPCLIPGWAVPALQNCPYRFAKTMPGIPHEWTAPKLWPGWPGHMSSDWP